MSNEVLFILWTLISITGILAAFRLGGKLALFGMVGVYIVLANIFVTKQITLFGYAATGGNALYGALFLATDLINEHYGRKEAQKAVWFGWASAFLFMVTSQAFLIFTPSANDFVHDAMKTIFALAPRIVIASLIAYIISQTHDVVAYNMWRKKTAGKHLWLRNNASTAVSQLIDSLLFALVAFWGLFDAKVLFEIVATTYFLKLLVAAMDTPFMYLSYRFRPKELLGE